MTGRVLVVPFAFWIVACGDVAAEKPIREGDGGRDAGASDSALAEGFSSELRMDASEADVSTSSDASEAGTMASIPNCAQGGPGLTNCGASQESCCTSLEVEGGTYYRTYDVEADGGVVLAADGGPTDEADPATVSSFRLDKYLVTVGRFRQFVNAWNGGAGYTPPAGSGKHTHLNGGLGLANSGDPGTYETGWDAADWSSTTYLDPTDATLACGPLYATWTGSVGSNENLPINCVNWYEAYAFCIWDGGFLPSEAEWEYAGAGGSQQREYPWGSMAPGTGNQFAIYGDGDGNCYYPVGSLAACTGVEDIAPVGTATLGAGLWGQLDLSGELSEWTLDWFTAYVDPCTDCAYLTVASSRVIRGGDFTLGTSFLLPQRHGGNFDLPLNGGPGIGFRCARTL